MMGKIGDKRRGWQKMRWLDSITNPVAVNLSKLWEIVEDGGNWCAAVHGSQRVRHDLVTEKHLPNSPQKDFSPPCLVLLSIARDIFPVMGSWCGLFKIVPPRIDN